jgi:signal transduction histidine kinase
VSESTWLWGVGAAILAGLLMWRLRWRRTSSVADGCASTLSESPVAVPQCPAGRGSQSIETVPDANVRLERHVTWLQQREANRVASSARMLAVVSNATVSLQRCSELAGADQELQEHLDRTLDRLQSAMRSLRGQISPLGDVPLEGIDLRTGLDTLLTEAQRASLTEVESRIDSSVYRSLSAVEATSVLYVVQEALANAIRHANASRFGLRAEVENGRFAISISDDGRGFDLLPGGQPECGGLVRMRRRAEAVRGLFQIESAWGAGTIVTLTIPRP